MTNPAIFSRREREIMDIVYRLGEAGAHEVTRHMKDGVGHDTVRVTLAILEKKGHVKHRKDGRRNIYAPTVPRERATKTAVQNLTRTFFKGSPSKAILTMLDLSSSKLTEAELDDIAAWIEQERKSK
jgi:predicted transcriptional regulator